MRDKYGGKQVLAGKGERRRYNQRRNEGKKEAVTEKKDKFINILGRSI